MKIREEEFKIRVGLSVSLGCDFSNRLTGVRKDGVLSALYTYDAGGRRVRSWDTVEGAIDYVYSGLNIVDEISGGVHERHVYAGGMHIASNTTGTVEYYHVDHLGSTRLKTAMNGSAIYSSNYEPFGVSSDETGDEDYRYTGKQEDPTGLYYYGARYYDPDTGRFTTRDTYPANGENPQTLNRYIYCLNNPLKYTDPDGRLTVQFGYGASVRAGPFGFTANEGLVINPNPLNFQIGGYTDYGGGGAIGGEANIGPQITFTPFSDDINDIKGETFTMGASLGLIGCSGGISVSAPITDDGLDLWGFSVTFDLPIPLLSYGVGATLYTSTTHSEVFVWVDPDITNYNEQKIQNEPFHRMNEAYFTLQKATEYIISDWDEYDQRRGVYTEY